METIYAHEVSQYRKDSERSLHARLDRKLARMWQYVTLWSVLLIAVAPVIPAHFA